MVKRIRIAFIGARSSGKSYLLYDMIHAFELLGYHPEELLLSYPHSSFGAYFYDTFNNATGGMRGTERYACRPESHYGAHLRHGRFGCRLAVDFLNIPGEVFDLSNTHLRDYFELKRHIERKGKGLFWLQEWRSPSGHLLRLIVPPGFDITQHTPVKALARHRHGNYLQWENIASELQEGQYTLQRQKTVSGRYMLHHLTELYTDSVLLTLEQCWSMITQQGHLDLDDYKANQVLHYFYPLHFCEEATDIIICDKLTDPHSAGSLTEAVASYMDLTKRHNPNVYLAFRGADLLLGSYAPFSDRSQAPQLARRPSLRNTLYSDVVSLLAPLLRTSQPAPEGLYLPDEWRRHILQSTGTGIGNAFWHLLNASVSHNWLGRQFHQLRGTKSVFELSSAPDSYLPPHVYLTSTPIDSHLRIYTSDPDDVTRFYCTEGSHIQSFTQTIRQGNSQHLCFGSYQLLTDVLLQNGLYPSGLRNRPPLLKYAQSKL